MWTRTNRINDIAIGELCPEKAGVGGSIPSLATIPSKLLGEVPEKSLTRIHP
jgi:hypothetical protein